LIKVDEANYYYIENVKSKMVLELQGGIDAEGMAVVQNKNYKNLNQMWRFDNI
jgi:hypothetical protein